MITETTVKTATLTGYRHNRFDTADPNRVNALVDSMLDKGYDDWHPIYVCGTEVINGRHRSIAARRVGIKEIPAIAIDEDELDEILEDAGRDYERASVIIAYRIS